MTKDDINMILLFFSVARNPYNSIVQRESQKMAAVDSKCEMP